MNLEFILLFFQILVKKDPEDDIIIVLTGYACKMNLIKIKIS